MVWSGAVRPGAARWGLAIGRGGLLFKENMSKNEYPIDFESVEKGRFFPNSELETVLGCQQSATAFRFAVMGLQRMIHSRTGFTCKIAEDGLRVLTDCEAATYNHRRHMNHRRGMIRRHLLALEVDAAKLTDEQRKEHEQNLIVQGRNVQALIQARKGITSPRPDIPKIAEFKAELEHDVQ